MLEQITPIILTYNEAPNIERTLEQLRWARDIVVVDSFSDDETRIKIGKFPQARIFQRRFDSHEKQWNFALNETGIDSEWALALDADYVLTGELVRELRSLKPAANINGYRAQFIYCVHGHRLRSSAYPPVIALYRRAGAFYRQDGHTQRLVIGGTIQNLRSPILHDDRKPLGRWLYSQDRYAQLETIKLSESDVSTLGWADRLRKMRFFSPFVMLLYCLFVKGTIRDGRAGIYYAFQRMVAELLLSLHTMEHHLACPDQNEIEPQKSSLDLIRAEN